MNTLELVRRIIRQHTNTVGQVVTNLYGAVAGLSDKLTPAAKASWLHASVPSGTLLDINAFYALYSTQHPRVHEILQAIDGVVVVTDTRPNLQLLRGICTTPVGIVFPLIVDTSSTAAQFAVYVDSVLVRKGVNTLTVTIALDAGVHVLEVLAMTQNLIVAAPPTLAIVGDSDHLDAPVWESLTTGYTDETSGQLADLLTWHTDPRAGGWRVLRRVLQALGTLVTVGALDKSGLFGVEIDGGDWTGPLHVGLELYAGDVLMGLVAYTNFDAVANTTSVGLHLDPQRTTIAAEWQGSSATIGNMTEVHRVQRTNAAGLIKWDDTAVTLGQGYDYALQSFGLFDETVVSPYSDIRYIAAGDVFAPGPIAFLPGFPKVSNGNATVKFTTPADLDYQGVRVYYARTVPGTASAGTSTSLTAVGAFVGFSFVGAFCLITGGTGATQIRQVLSNTDDVLTFDTPEAFATAPDATSTFTVVSYVPIVTDFGKPGTTDELNFDIVHTGAGNYVFRTFDRSNNQQGDDAAVWWAYVPGQDGPSPIILPLQAEGGPAFEDPKREGMAWQQVIFEESAATIDIYGMESADPEVPVPELAANRLCYSLKRQEGDQWNAIDQAFIVGIATRTNYWRKTVSLGVGYDGQRGPTVVWEAQAIDLGTGPAGPPTSFVVVSSGTTRRATWVMGDPDAFTLLFRNGYGIVLAPGTEAFLDSNTNSEIPYTYEICHWLSGQTSALLTFATVPPSSADPRVPTWQPGYPIGINDHEVDFRWTDSDPTTDEIVIETNAYTIVGLWVPLATFTDVGHVPTGAYIDGSQVRGRTVQVRLRARVGGAYFYSAPIKVTWGYPVNGKPIFMDGTPWRTVSDTTFTWKSNALLLNPAVTMQVWSQVVTGGPFEMLYEEHSTPLAASGTFVYTATDLAGMNAKLIGTYLTGGPQESMVIQINGAL